MFDSNTFKTSSSKILIVILLFTALTRFYRLDFPEAYVFDEVYHGFTSKEYLKTNPAAWDPFATPPKGVAFEWTHPPLAKEIMAASMFLTHSTDAWAFRLPGAILGILSVYIVYSIGLQLFNKPIAVLSAFIFSIEGLNFVQSRTGMNDVYFVTFMLTSLLFFLKERFLLTAIFLGLSFGSKWTAIYLLLFFILFIIKKHQFKIIPYFLIVPIIYLLTYIPYFLLGYGTDQFIELQRQMWYYHTHLKATHDYASAFWSWPLNLYPVWYSVEYFEGKMANIFASGNPIVFWMGLVGLILTMWEYIRTRSEKLLIILLGYLIFWLPWTVSPRIMFLYHYSPSVPFLTLSLGYQLNKLYQNGQKTVAIFLLILMLLGFILMYPFLTGIPLPKEWVDFFFYTNLTKNPF